MSRDIKHTESATQATQHTENINPNENNIKCFTFRIFESLKSIDDEKLLFYMDAYFCYLQAFHS